LTGVGDYKDENAGHAQRLLNEGDRR
jgi:hypothetical protein